MPALPLRSLIPRLAFYGTALIACMAFWISRHPPMVDLPQHAGQVALLLDLLHGTSSWQDIFYINYFTPYWVGYGLWAALASAMPLTVAMQVVLTLAFVGFVSAGVYARKSFGADDRLDWLLIPAFFGFAFKWGLLTFLLAAPLGIVFMTTGMRYALAPSRKLAWLLFLSGLVLFFCHALVFALSIAVAGTFLLRDLKTPLLMLRKALPYLCLLPLVWLYLHVSAQNATSNTFNYGSVTTWHLGLDRLLKLLIYCWGDLADGFPMLAFGTLTLLLPLLIGSRIQTRLIVWVPFTLTLLVWLLTPHSALKTSLLYERFSLFMPVFYILLYRRPLAEDTPLVSDTTQRVAGLMLPLICILFIASKLHDFQAFADENRDYSLATAQVPERQRVLALSYDSASAAARNAFVYMHYASWYQAEHHGLVDFNFAWYPPLPVRFKPDQIPGFAPGLEWSTEPFDWQTYQGEKYDYFFVRSEKPLDPDLFKNPHCLVIPFSTVGAWHIYKKTSCS